MAFASIAIVKASGSHTTTAVVSSSERPLVARVPEAKLEEVFPDHDWTFYAMWMVAVI
jgi:hypothetical protein